MIETIEPTKYVRPRDYATSSNVHSMKGLIEPTEIGKKERIAANSFDFGQQEPRVEILSGSVPYYGTTYSALVKLDVDDRVTIEPTESGKKERIAESKFDFSLVAARVAALAGSFRSRTLVGPIAHDIEIDVVFLVMQRAAVASLRRLVERAITGEPAARQPLEKSLSAQPSAADLRVDRITAIQAAMGLPMQTLADILNISRPCLYQWIDANGDDRTLRSENRERLAMVERLAKQWLKRSNAPLSLIAHEPLNNGQTVLAMLTQEEVDQKAVLAAFDQLVDKLKHRPKTRSQRMAEAGFKRRSTHRSLPKDE